ncbi:hypothetical protein ACVW00_003540 [Marmoricola sp. URHA0025 HA25]
MAAAREAVEDALALGARPLPNAETGALELAGYARFLRYAGNHLHTLMRLAEVRNDGITRLIHRLNNVAEIEPARKPAGLSLTGDDVAGDVATAGSRWLHAATLLGTAHDVVATHLTGVGIPRTPEGEESLTGPALVPACVDLASLILTAVDGSGDLIRRTTLAQKRQTQKTVPMAALLGWHRSNRAASIYARAALWDLNQQLTNPRTSTSTNQPRALEQLRVASRLDQLDNLGHFGQLDRPGQSGPPAFGTSLAALRVLRHYSYAQARGLSAASPASLRDLALLGARITDPETMLRTLTEVTDASTGLDRLRRAHLVDQLTTAHDAWSAAAAELTRTVQGLTKAPAGYGAAIGHLLHADLSPELHRALAAVLPAMGTQAASTVTQLAQRADLVTLQRPPLATRHEWRPILPDHAATISERFTTAARKSRHALTISSQLQALRQQRQSARPHNRVQIEDHRELSGQVAP